MGVSFSGILPNRLFGKPAVQFQGTLQAQQPKFQAAVSDTFERVTPEPTEPLNVLLLEDSEELIELIKLSLQEFETGLEVKEVAKSYDEAIEKFRSSQPDIVLLDKNILGSKTGVDVYNTLKDEYGYPEERMIFTSSEPLSEQVRGKSAQVSKADVVSLNKEHGLIQRAMEKPYYIH